MPDAYTMLVTAMNDPSATPEQSAAIAALLETAAFSGGTQEPPHPPRIDDPDL
ncbi:hypothetical protein J2X47_001949 [Sphingomonas sp. BE270]|uniref:hypothetical protein n=1 Tax=Sphingomonas sp. BE270 TaxID=2817726 RepID=UPI0028604C0D|nr:hypothetical protein [Sphingomonas sp. BE270]MDR7257769.1 hypothetical protein [Sphingomonas sp. BE270]